MKYHVSALNMNDGTYYVLGDFTNAKKATKFAEDLAETGIKEIKVVNETKMQVIGAYNF